MRYVLAGLAVLVVCSQCAGAINVPSDGSDGEFSPTANIVIDLSQAPTGAWDQPGDGRGVYDPQKWAVVFKYSAVNVPSGVTVSFKNHPSYAPVVWLVQGDTTIGGTVSVEGRSGANYQSTLSQPGPGGFRGAWSGNRPGLGPGGGSSSGTGSYSYGNPGVMPLIGGSGSGSYSSTAGGAGGGVILVASGGVFTLSGTIGADGGDTGSWSQKGSGGGIRIIADVFNGSGNMYARGASSSYAGRIRVEANTTEFLWRSDPVFAFARPGADAVIWPGADAPKVKLISLGGQAIPDEPRADLTWQNTDLYFDAPGTQALIIQADNVPLNWKVKARVAPMSSGSSATWANAVFVSGDATNSTWSANISMPDRYSIIQVRASAE